MVAENRSVFTGVYRPITLSTLTLVALAAFDGMAVAAALPKIGSDLGVGRLPWVLTAFQFASTVAMLAAGSIIDAIGVRRAYRLTLIVFFVASLLCTIAPNLQTLIAARVLQGIGGGSVMAVTLAIVGLSYPAELRPRAYAANSTVWGLMALVGPAASAFLLTVVSWRGIFLLNLPLVAFAGIIGWNRLPATDGHRLEFDTRGLAIVAALVFALLVSLSSLQWSSLIGVGIAVVLALIYWWWTGHTAQAVVARRHFARWPFGPMNMIPFTFFAGSLAVDAFLPIYIRGGLGRSNAIAAFGVAFLAIGWTTGSNIVSRLLDRVTNVDAMVAGFILTLPSLGLAAVLYTSHASLVLVYALSFLQGLGIGSVTNATISLLQRTADAAEMGRVSAAHQFMRQLGGTLGTALAGAVLFGAVVARLGSVEPVRRLLDGDHVELGGAGRAAIATGFRGAAALAFALTLAGLFLALYVRRRFRQDAGSTATQPSASDHQSAPTH